MDSRFLLTVCVLAVSPMVTEQFKCYTCTGTSVDGAANKCVDGDLGDADSQACTDVAGEVMKCSQEKGKIADTGIETVTRACFSAPSGTADSCTDIDLAGVETHTCFCSSDNCNGQTALTPAIVTCLVSLLLAIYATE